ncbi:MAG: 3'-5' exonuclease [Gemmatimonadota bacterium]|nr:3'-5' exonuclease [Gemmatimonadota bacterium]
MMGTSAYPDSTLLERVMAQLRVSPRTPLTLCHEVLGLLGAPAAICDRVAIALLGADPRVRQLEDGRWGLVPEAQGSPLLDDCAFAVVDVETTGVRSGYGDRITEIAVAVVHGERREIVFETLVNPERSIPRAVCAITNISNEMVRNAPRFSEVAERLLAALAGRVFVAHNARFDWNFVSAELRRSRDLTLDGTRFCTVRLARRLVKGVRSCGLDNLCRFFGFRNEARHRAGGDALVTAELLFRLLSLARQEGARTLQDLMVIEARRYRRGRRRKRSAMPTEPRADSCQEELT